jgi:DNA-binding response OmpR family regulator
MAPSSWRRSGLQFHQILVVAAQRATASQLGEMLRGFSTHGAIAWTASQVEAMDMAARLKPKLLFVEQAGGFEGLSFVRHLRKSATSSRKAPVILLSEGRTVGDLRRAQNAGAHEFLVIPFEPASLLRRLDAICGAPRAWIESAAYVGPDRRRFNSAEEQADGERRKEKVKA